MNELNSWRIVPGVTVLLLLNGKKEIYLASPEQKQQLKNVTKVINEPYQALEMGDNKFKIKITHNESSNENECGIKVLVSSELLPEPNEWYVVRNLVMEHIGEFIESSDSKNGVLLEDFMAVFSDIDGINSMVSFTNEKMRNYESCLDEMQRRLNCELFSKTKKLKPGHRYDTLKETRYYLCPVMIRKTNENKSEFILEPEDLSVGYLYVNKLKDEKSVSEILNTRHFGDDEFGIKISYTTNSMVDSGEVISDDFSGNIMDYWESMYNTNWNYYIITDEYGYQYQSDLTNILKMFSLTSTKDNILRNKNKWTEILINLVNDNLYNIILNNWNIGKFRNELVIKDNKDKKENQDALLVLFINYLKNDCNILKNTYYRDLFNWFDINVENLIENQLNEWSEISLVKDFDTFYKHSTYFKERQLISNISQQRNMSNNYGIEKKLIKDLFGEGILTDTITKLITKANNKFGKGVDKYTVINVGTKANPIEYVSCIVSIKNILDFYNNKLDDEIKSDILKNRFNNITVIFDRNKNIE